MISYILYRKPPLFWLLFHSLLGILSTLTPWVIIFWFYLIFLTSMVILVRKAEDSFLPIVFLISYATSFELLARMSGTSPFVPYELGKYLLFILLGFGVLKGYRRGYVGWLMLFLLLPGAFFDLSGESTFRNIVFNLSGPINVALAIVFFRKQEIGKYDLIETMRLMFYPLVSVLAFTIIKSPDLQKVEFNLGGNFETSGGFGTNQVSTALGFGAFLVFVFWQKRWVLSGYKWIDIAIFLFFIFRGLVTFSRGGMIGGALGIILLVMLDRGELENANRPIRTVLTAVPILILLLFTFIYADKITGGLLVQRYQGETPGTLAGRKEKTLNIITSNRLQIFSDDLKLWKSNPVFGVGVGASRHLRDKSKGFLSHIEFSRLLSEHGVLGMVYLLILIILGIKIYRQQKNSSMRIILFALYTLALFTTFHSAMRTYLSPLLFGLSMISINEINGECCSEKLGQKL